MTSSSYHESTSQVFSWASTYMRIIKDDVPAPSYAATCLLQAYCDFINAWWILRFRPAILPLSDEIINVQRDHGDLIKPHHKIQQDLIFLEKKKGKRQKEKRQRKKKKRNKFMKIGHKTEGMMIQMLLFIFLQIYFSFNCDQRAKLISSLASQGLQAAIRLLMIILEHTIASSSQYRHLWKNCYMRPYFLKHLENELEMSKLAFNI